MSVSTIKDQDGKQYIIFDESELYDDSEMGDKLEDYEIQQILGKGSYGFVAKVRSKRNNKIYAMKQIDLSKVGSPKEVELCKREVLVLQKLNHPNINKYYRSFSTNNCLYLIMEFMDNGDLSGFIKAHEKFNKPVREVEVWNILQQSMNALEYIHSQNVIHRDIKPANLFMTNDKTIKIGDFGVAAKMAGMKTNVNTNPNFSGTVVGSPMFMSPEMLREEEYDKKTDVFSMGIAMYELCFFQSPKKAGMTLDGNIILKNVPLTKNQNYYSKQLLTILQSMITENKNQRPTSSQLCQTIRAQYIQAFLKTSSLSSVTRCLSLLRLRNNLMKIEINENIHPITKGFLNAVQQIENNINDKFNQFKEVLAIHNPKLNSDTEIDPVYIVAYLLEKIHKETNKVNQTNNDEYVINSVFNGMDEDKSSKNEMFEKFFKYFLDNFNSQVSNLFFGIIKEKKLCQKCNMLNYNFGCFCLLTFNLNEICGTNYKSVDLINLFQALHDRKKQYSLQDQIYCDRCLCYQPHIKTKQLYSMPYELIITIERGVNYFNRTLINFPFDLDLSNVVELDGSPKRFKLVGTVNYIDINGEDHYISFCKNKINDKWICADNDKINDVNGNMAMTYGIPILLFYSFVRQNH